MRLSYAADPENIGKVLLQARTASGFSLRQLAQLAETSHTTLCAYEANRKVPSTATFLRILRACNYAVDLELKPRIRSHRGMPRGEELAEVLTLAEQFPARHSRTLTFPRFKQAK